MFDLFINSSSVSHFCLLYDGWMIRLSAIGSQNGNATERTVSINTVSGGSDGSQSRLPDRSALGLTNSTSSLACGTNFLQACMQVCSRLLRQLSKGKRIFCKNLPIDRQSCHTSSFHSFIKVNNYKTYEYRVEDCTTSILIGVLYCAAVLLCCRCCIEQLCVCHLQLWLSLQSSTSATHSHIKSIFQLSSLSIMSSSAQAANWQGAGEKEGLQIWRIEKLIR